MKASEIRREFLNFFAERGHERVASGPLVPADDPTLLFTNAGMVQFKDVFVGRRASPYARAVTAQKCVRAGGKHNDLENVGKTARHQTFFEMLGNFSFGDYFRREAIAYAWELMTKILGLSPDRLWASVFRDDDEAFELWTEVAGLPPERIVRLGEEDNFWSMGDTGPCGPCSEIHYDRGPEHRCAGQTCAIGECDCDRWVEVWNLVFMQYEREAGGSMTPLERPGIDTGMGLERMAAILQGVESNFDIDLFLPLMRQIESLSGHTYGGTAERGDLAFRVIADHARCAVFLIADGVFPTNEGRGYVLRRILRRAFRFGRVLGLEEPFLHRLVETVARSMGDAYPEVRERSRFAREVICAEEERFGATLEAGLQLLEEIVGRTLAEDRDHISADDAFRLYDTFGFPLDLCEDVAEERGLGVDRAGFERLMQRQRERAREARREAGVSGELAGVIKMIREAEPTEFAGYETGEISARVGAVVTAEGRPGRLDPGGEGWVVLDRTPFYAEAGGQVADEGVLRAGGLTARVTDVQPSGDGRVLHRVSVEEGSLVEEAEVVAGICGARRAHVARNHTATHLLHAALREVLGEHVRQAGSRVAPDGLRFDFTHHSAVEGSHRREIEDRVNRWILEAHPVHARRTGYERALEEGALALFGERYGEGDVRVVTAGDVSMELCGGTHVGSTSEIGSFKLTSEGSIGSGLRRVEAVTGWGAIRWMHRQEDLLAGLAGELDSSPEDITSRVRELRRTLRDRDRRVQQLEARLGQMQVATLAEGAEQVGDVSVLAARVDAADADGLRQMADSLRGGLGDSALVLAAVQGDRVLLIGAATPAAVQGGADMGQVVGRLGRELGGGGGGRPDMAQAGGDRVDRLDEVLSLGLELLREMLSKGSEEHEASR